MGKNSVRIENGTQEKNPFIHLKALDTMLSNNILSLAWKTIKKVAQIQKLSSIGQVYFALSSKTRGP